MRIVLVDALFLRADELRRRGRVEELPSLYGTLLEIDPGNEAAYDHLAGVFAFDLPAESARPEERADWWREGWETVERGLVANPGSPRLLVRAADLLLTVEDEEALRSAPPRELGDPAVAGVERLLEAARATEDVPRRGRAHLLLAATAIPELAARRLPSAPESFQRLLVAGDALLGLRGERLESMTAPSMVEMEAPPSLRALLADSLVALREVAAARAAGDRSAALAAADRLLARYPDWLSARSIRRAAEGDRPP
jgi:hypothetical protein